MKRYEMYVCECPLGPHAETRENEDGGWVRADDVAVLEARVAELEALLPRIASLRDAYWKSSTECDLGCCFDPLIERLSEDAKKLIY